MASEDSQQNPKQLRMLAPDSFREKLSRRAFLQGGTALAGFALVAAACGNSSSDAMLFPLVVVGFDISHVPELP